MKAALRLLLISAGLGLAVPAVTRAVVGSVPRGDIGKASGSFSMMRQLGSAFGVAIAAAVYESRPPLSRTTACFTRLESTDAR